MAKRDNPAAASSSDVPLTRWQKFRLVGLVILKRVRFIAILAGVGLLVGKWNTILNYWDKWTHPRSVAARQLAADEEFYCPMHPQVVRSTYEPNGDAPNCPICGMPLSLRKKGVAAQLPPGVTARVQLSPERIQLAGIQTVPVAYRPFARQTTTVGYVAYDESRLSKIVSRVEGYVEKLYVDKSFAVVHQGDPLAEIYSPELYSTAQELILATQRKDIGSLAASARQKLLLYGVSPQEIDAIVASGRGAPRLVIRSPQTGYVVDKRIVAGAAVEAKMTLFEVADLSAVWVEADVYEKDIPYLRPGQTVKAAVEAYPDRPFMGKLALVYPQLDAATRTNRVRFELQNPQHELRPGMFATVRINTPLESVEPFKSLAERRPRSGQHAEAGGDNGAATAVTREKEGPHPNPLPKGDGTGDMRPLPTNLRSVPGEGTGDIVRAEFLSVPERAVIDTGAKKVVYVERKPGVFEGVEVELGPREGPYYPVVKGLKAGDQVAAAGGFLIDAETRLNPAAASTYFGASGGPQSAEQATVPTPRNSVQGESQESGPPRVSEEDMKNINQLPEADRPLALAQRTCPITGAVLGSMGVPVKIVLRGRPVFLCCKGCVAKAQNAPDDTIRKVEELKRVNHRGQKGKP